MPQRAEGPVLLVEDNREASAGHDETSGLPQLLARDALSELWGSPEIRVHFDRDCARVCGHEWVERCSEGPLRPAAGVDPE